MDLDRVKAIARYYNDVLEHGQRVYIVGPNPPLEGATPTRDARKVPGDHNVTEYGAPGRAALLHLRAMVPELIEMADAGRTEKCMRWLGFMQGVLWRNGAFTLDELKEHSRPDVPAPVWPEPAK